MPTVTGNDVMGGAMLAATLFTMRFSSIELLVRNTR
jgi:hypothetical protein